MKLEIKDINGLIYFSGKIYMISPYIQALFEYDFSTKEVKKICGYPENIKEEGAFEKMVGCENKIYLFPCRTDSIYYYDIYTQKYKELIRISSISENVPIRKFFDVIKYEGFIYAVCCCPNMVIRINSSNDDVQVWKLDDRSINHHIVNHMFSACAYEGKLIYPYSADIIIEFDINDESFRVVHLERESDNLEEKYGYIHGMAVNNKGKQWVYNWYGEVFEIENHSMKKLEIPSELNGVYNDGLSEEQYKISRIFFENSKIYFLLQYDYRILIYDTLSKEFSWSNNPFDMWNEARRKMAYIAYARMDAEKFILYNYNDGRMYIYDINNGFIENLTLDISADAAENDPLLREYFRLFFMRNDELRTYIKYVKENCNGILKKSEGRCGEAIYRATAGEND